jgi:hypothetical protein
MLNISILDAGNQRRFVVEGNRLALGTLMLLILSIPALRPSAESPIGAALCALWRP